MSVIGLDGDDQRDIMKVVAAILHLGNVQFVEERNFARVEDEHCKCNSFSFNKYSLIFIIFNHYLQI